MTAKKRPGWGGDLITITQAARLRGVTPQAIDSLLSRGRLKAAAVVAGRRLLRRSDVLKFRPGRPGRPKKEAS